MGLVLTVSLCRVYELRLDQAGEGQGADGGGDDQQVEVR